MPHAKQIESSHAVLLVIDMQNDFYDESGNAAKRNKPVALMQSLPPKINRFASQLRGKKVRIIFTRFIYDPTKSPGNFVENVENTKNSNWLCVVGTKGAELSGVEVAKDDIVIDKYSYDVFAGTNLKQLLDQSNVENIVITGVRTEICIMASASRSFAEGYRTFVISDLVGTYDDKKTISDSILASLEYSSFVMTSTELLNLLN